VTVLWISFAARRRFHAEKLAGRALLRVPMFDERLPQASPFRRWLNIVLGSFMALIMLAAISFSVVEGNVAGNPRTLMVNTIFMGMACGFWISNIVLPFWWRNNLRFGEFGILWDRRVVMWDHLVEYDWKASMPRLLELKGIDRNNMDVVWRVAVQDDQLVAVQNILEAKFQEKPGVEILAPMGELGSTPLSLAVRDRRFPTYIGMIVLWMVGFGIFMYYVQTGFTGIREFDRSIFWGFILSGFLSPRLWRSQIPQVGAPLVHLSARRTWVRAPLFAFAAAAFYFVGTRFGLLAEWIGYGSGFGFGWALAKLITCFMRGRLDLRENGVYCYGNFWPWSEIRVSDWNSEGPGRLVLGHDWGRIIATVPTEKRAVVSAVLSQKKGIEASSGGGQVPVEVGSN
jgi:hypothetical protein